MPLQFRNELDIPALPVDVAAAGALARQYAADIAAAGSRKAAAKAAVDAVLARPDDEPAGERHRLQRLYADVYTRAELERLVLNSFAEVGLRG